MAFELPAIVGKLKLDTGEYNKNLKSIESSSEETFKKVASLAVQYLSFQQVTRFIKENTAAYMVQQKAIEAYKSALRNQGAEIESNTRRASAFASELQNVTVYGDEFTQMMMAQGLNLGIQTGQIEDATRAAMVLAQKYNTDLSTAMMLMGRASQGQTQMLTRYGIVLDENMTAEEKFNVLLKMGRDEFGLVTDAAKTAEGRMTQYKNTIGDAGEEIGKELLPAVLSLTGGMADLAKSFIDADPMTRKMIISAGELAAVIVIVNTGLVKSALVSTAQVAKNAALAVSNGILTGSFVGLKVAIEAMNKSLAANPIGWAIVLTTGLIAACNLWGQRELAATEASKKSAEAALDAARKRREVVDAENSKTQAKINRLNELSKYEQINNKEMEESGRIIGELTDKYGNINAYVDKATGKLIIQKNAWTELTEEMKKAKHEADLSEAKTSLANAKVNKALAFSRLEQEYVMFGFRGLDYNSFLNMLNNTKGTTPEATERLAETMLREAAQDLSLDYTAEQRQCMRDAASAIQKEREDKEKFEYINSGKDLEEARQEAEHKKSVERNQAYEAYSDKKKQYEYDAMSTAQKLTSLSGELGKLKQEQWEAVGCTGKPEADYSKEELERQTRILELTEERKKLVDQIRNSSGMDVKQYYELIEAERRHMEELRQEQARLQRERMRAALAELGHGMGDSTGKSRETLNAATNKYREISAAIENADRKLNYYESKLVDTVARQNDNRHDTEGKASFSLQALSLMAGRDSGAERAARAAEKAVKLLEEIQRNTEPDLTISFEDESGVFV